MSARDHVAGLAVLGPVAMVSNEGELREAIRAAQGLRDRIQAVTRAIQSTIETLKAHNDFSLKGFGSLQDCAINQNQEAQTLIKETMKELRRTKDMAMKEKPLRDVTVPLAKAIQPFDALRQTLCKTAHALFETRVEPAVREQLRVLEMTR